MTSQVTAPYAFWRENPVVLKYDVPFDNKKFNFDSLVIVSKDISKIVVPDSSYLKDFIQLLQHQKQVDAGFDKVETFIAAHVSHYEGINKLIHSPTGPLDRHYDDARRFTDAAYKGIQRALKAGAIHPILAVLFDKSNDPQGKYNNYEIAALLGAAEAIYVPLELREDVPAKSRKVDVFGFTSFENNVQQLRTWAEVELGRIICRDIGGSDPERMAAPGVARFVSELFTGTRIQVEIIEDQKVIEKEYPLLGAVNRATRGVQRHHARVIILTYEPEGPYDKTVVLVGKGVTYDTGGADIKAGGVMAGMHRDKCGAAAVAGLLLAVQALGSKGVKVIGAMSMVRNSVGSECYVSDEIITSRAGVRVRVGNTDAEGRMAMADVLCHMKEKVLSEGCPNPFLFTIATLTGHAHLAVGDGYTIVMENGPAAAENVALILQKAGYQVGDNVEISTIRREDYEFHQGKSEYEDLIQCNNLPSSRTPRGHQTPGAFLIMASGLDKHDVNSQAPLKYCHVDIAGSSGPFPGVPTGSPIPAFASAFFM